MFSRLGRWQVLSSVFGNDNYFRIAGKLANAGIPCRTRNRTGFARQRRGMGCYQNTCYDILVRKEDVHRAAQVINSR